MGQWLITDLSVSDVHFQVWMLLVTGICLAVVRLGDAVAFAERFKLGRILISARVLLSTRCIRASR
jgi:hypothetical protein